VPAPDVARRALERMQPGTGPLLPALAAALTDLTGADCPVSAFDLRRLDRHLRMRVEIVDDHGTPLAAGRDLVQLKARFGVADLLMPAAFPAHPLERDGITTWDFGALPRQITLPGPGGALLLHFPALVDAGETCALRIFDDEAAAIAAHRGGVRALLIHALAAGLPTAADVAPAAALYRRLGTPEALLADLRHAIVDSVWTEPTAPRSADEFAALAHALAAPLQAATVSTTAAVTDTLRLWRDVEKQLARAATLPLLELAADLRDQLGRLVYAGFVAHTPLPWLTELPRYLDAARQRLDRAQGQPGADTAARQSLQPLWHAFWQVYPARSTLALTELRWLLEELRVQLFAPSLGTRQPVSVARLTRLLEAEVGAPPALRAGRSG
jgi:ATP-dependent helicase HrpA